MLLKIKLSGIWSSLVLMILLSSCNRDETVEDIDGNIYKTIKIGNQVWMAENLRVTKFRNGDPIVKETGNESWANTEAAAYCDYNNSEENGKTFGHLYNWHAVSDTRGIAPKGWHIPNNKEIAQLIDFLKSDTIAAAKLKEAGTTHWLSPNKGANNETSFSALPGGYRFGDGTFHTLGSNGYWWTETRTFEMFSWSPRIWSGFADVERDSQYLTYGFSIRCIKD